MIRLMQIIQCNKSEHWFFTLAKQKKARYEYRAVCTIQMIGFPFFLCRH